jgi:hypothetical protein
MYLSLVDIEAPSCTSAPPRAGSRILKAPGQTLAMGPTKKEKFIAYKIIMNS